jgi:hypothetical protein
MVIPLFRAYVPKDEKNAEYRRIASDEFKLTIPNVVPEGRSISNLWWKLVRRSGGSRTCVLARRNMPKSCPVVHQEVSVKSHPRDRRLPIGRTLPP